MDLNLNEVLCTFDESAEVITITTMIMAMITMMMAAISPLIMMITTMMVSWRSNKG